MLIAVTGGTGFVGRHVLGLLAASGQMVRALARSPQALSGLGGVTAVEGSLSDTNALRHLCDGADAILHLAGAISGSATHMREVNMIGTRNLLQAADRTSAKRLVHVSSLAAREPGLSPYGASKAAGEHEVNAAARGISTLIIRPPAVYGEGDLATLPLLKALTSRTAILPGTASARFSLIHAEDLARVCIAALDSNIEGLREVDDGYGGYGWSDVADTLRVVCGRPQRLVFIPRPAAMAVGHLADCFAALTRRPGMVSAAKMRELYHANWVARPPAWPRENPIGLAEGMRRTLGWAMAQGLLPQLSLADRKPAS